MYDTLYGRTKVTVVILATTIYQLVQEVFIPITYSAAVLDLSPPSLDSCLQNTTQSAVLSLTPVC